MASVMESQSSIHSPPNHDVRRPKGILKNSFQKSPPTSPLRERSMSEKEITIANTQINAGHRRSSSGARPPGSRRQSGHETDHNGDSSMRLQWDEANLYLTEQERSSTMKITEPKTPYAKHYDPSEDDDDVAMLDDEMGGAASGGSSQREEIPDLSLGEAEEEFPETQYAPRSASKVHVSDEDATPAHDADSELAHLTPEELEKHHKFERLRKKHYEMKDAAKFLGHPESIDDLADEEDEAAPPMPTINGAKVGAGD